MMKSGVVFSILSIFSGLLFQNCSDTNEITPADNWVQRSAFEGVARSSAVAFTIGDTAYVGTGLDAAKKDLSDFWQ